MTPPRAIPSWLDDLPSWIQYGRDSYNTNEDDSSRISSMVSASTRTKRKSRAQAMRKLEGRKFSETTTAVSTTRSSREEESESEDEDPWTDPWQWQRPPRARKSSSVYSDVRELPKVQEYFDEQIQNPFGEADEAPVSEARTFKSPDQIRNPFAEEDQAWTKQLKSPDHVKNPATDEDHSSSEEEVMSAEAKKHDLELQVRNALRQSHVTELTHPPKAYSVLSRFSLTPSDSPYRLSWLHSGPAQEDEECDKVQRSWRGAGRSYDPESWKGLDEDVKVLGWNGTRSIIMDPSKGLCQSSVDSKPSLCSEQLGSGRRVEKGSVPRDASIQLQWLHVISAFFVFFNTWGLVCAFGAFKSYYGQVLLPNTSQSSLSWIGSTQLAMLFFALVPAGQLVARGYFRIIFLAGTTFLVTGIFSASWCSSLATVWLTQGLIAGVGIGLVFGSASALAMQQYGEIATRLRLSVLGAPTGGLCHVLLAHKLMASYGPRTAMLVVAMVISLTMVLPLVVLLKVKWPLRKSAGGAGNQKYSGNAKRQHRLSSTPHLALVVSGLFFASLGAYFGLFYLDSGGLLPLQASMSPKLLIAALVASIPGCVLLAVLGRRATCLPCLPAVAMLNSCVMWLWLGLRHDVDTSMVVACLYGLLGPGIPMLCIPAVYSLCVEPATEVDRELLKARSSDVAWAFRPHGRRACVLFCCVAVACLGGSAACGALVDKEKHAYLAAQAFAGSALLAGGILLLGASMLYRYGSRDSG